MTIARNPLCVALDTPSLAETRNLARSLAAEVGCFKVGMEFFYAHGDTGYAAIAELGLPIFLDLKLHDIPNTVAAALSALTRLDPPPAIINVHAQGGLDMMRAARAAVPRDVRLIAVTVLTSLSSGHLAGMGFAAGTEPAELARSLAMLAAQAGLDGVVCSGHELAAIRAACGPDFLTVVPGIRPAGSAAQDQIRVTTPAEALAAGADLLVIGRPITAAPDPAAAARAILSEMEQVGSRAGPAVKICGLSSRDTLATALAAGADYVGLVFYPKSPRNVSLERAAVLADQARGRAKIVALTVDAADEEIIAIAGAVRPDYFQLHGAESPERVRRVRALSGKPVIKAIKVAGPADVAAAAEFARDAEIILFDAKSPEALKTALPGGNGRTFDWSLLSGSRGVPGRFMLSGGLNPGNIAAAVAMTGARMVDVSSGVETAPGVKDSALIAKFIESARAAR